MGTRAVNIQINDNVSPSIAPKIQDIAKSARDADAAVASLKGQLNTFNSTAGLSQQLRSISTSTNTLVRATNAMGNAANLAAPNVVKLANSYNTLNFAVQGVITTLNAYSTTALAASGASKTFSLAAGGAKNSTQGLGNGALAARASLQVATGSMMGASRAAGVFIAQTLGLGKLLQFAFPVIGAIALLEVLEQIVTGIGHVIDAYKKLDMEAIKVEADAIRSGERILKLKPESSLFSAEGIAKIFKGGGPLNQEITIKNAQTVLRDVTDERRIAEAQARVNEAGLQGEALQKQRTVDLQKQQDLIFKQKTAVQQLADEYYKLYTSSHKITPSDSSIARAAKSGLDAPQPVEVPNLTEAQRKAVGEQLATATREVKNLDTEFKILGFDIQASAKKEPLAALKDEAKAAREQMKQFEEQFAQLKQQNKLLMPQEVIEFWTKLRAIAKPQNIPAIDLKIGTANQEVERQKATIQSLFDRVRDQASSIGVYSDALREKTELDKIDLQLQKDHITLDAGRKKELTDLVHYIATHNEYERELKSVYQEATEPLRAYEAALQAINDLEKRDGAITAQQAAIARAQVTKQYTDAVFPLNEYVHGLQNEIDVLGKYGTQLKVAIELQKVQNDLRAKGRTLTEAEKTQLSDFLVQLNRQQQVNTIVNELYDQNIGQVEKLTAAYAATIQARQKNIISEDQEAVSLAHIKTELADVAIAAGDYAKNNVFTSIFGHYLDDIQSFATATTKLYQGVFKTIADGIADSLGRAIVYADNLGSALKDVARSALSQIISGVIKLGIQWLITAALGRAIGASATAATAAEAAATAAAWAPAAALASLATLGANAAPADSALISTTTLASALSLLHFAEGGVVPGFGSGDTVPSLLTPGEFVVNRQAAMANRDLLEQMNRGTGAIRANGLVSVGSTVKSNIKIEVIHDGSTAIEVQQVSDEHIRVLAQREVEKHSPRVFAADLQNPNSQSSKAVRQYVTPTRVR